ncbi:DUF5681 domain-containing protein [Tsuneonella sp. YG55]|uniref:DUF5681 domain-containing protein n=1 Tax=Tsuneonella litorea TaxID=2976475 RepID=A0A9X2VY72_9SPHN|nr:DUF5681 domain-containing protein [Tsuneonella litorea]MCT2557502.1 DUF5681 domain-containing protein [Tsuneonella litorea]
MNSERDYEVGKGKPPKASQFKPGQSGNPAGARRHKRRKSGFTLRELAIACANEIMTITINGQKYKVTKKEALFISVFNDALAGDPAHRLRALRELREIGAFDPAPHQPLSRTAAIHKLVERLAKEAERELEWTRQH